MGPCQWVDLFGMASVDLFSFYLGYFYEMCYVLGNASRLRSSIYTFTKWSAPVPFYSDMHRSNCYMLFWLRLPFTLAQLNLICTHSSTCSIAHPVLLVRHFVWLDKSALVYLNSAYTSAWTIWWSQSHLCLLVGEQLPTSSYRTFHITLLFFLFSFTFDSLHFRVRYIRSRNKVMAMVENYKPFPATHPKYCHALQTLFISYSKLVVMLKICVSSWSLYLSIFFIMCCSAANLVIISLSVHKAMQRLKNSSKRTTMLNVDGKKPKNSHLFCQHLLVSSASMITELQLHHIPMILLAQVSWLCQISTSCYKFNTPSDP